MLVRLQDIHTICIVKHRPLEKKLWIFIKNFGSNEIFKIETDKLILSRLIHLLVLRSTNKSFLISYGNTRNYRYLVYEIDGAGLMILYTFSYLLHESTYIIYILK